MCESLCARARERACVRVCRSMTLAVVREVGSRCSSCVCVCVCACVRRRRKKCGVVAVENWRIGAEMTRYICSSVVRLDDLGGRASIWSRRVKVVVRCASLSACYVDGNGRDRADPAVQSMQSKICDFFFLSDFVTLECGKIG